MKTSEIKELSNQELIERIENEQDFLVRQRLNHAISQLDNPLKIRETRRTIARLKTELTMRSREEKVENREENREENKEENKEENSQSK